MRRLLVLAAVLAAALPAAAQNPWGTCNASARTLGVCRVGSVAWFAFDVPDAAMVAEVQEWTTDVGGYRVTVPCAQDRSVTKGVLDAAGVTEGDCTALQIGEEVANPQTANEFAYVFMRNALREGFRQWKQQRALELVLDEPEPNFGAEP